MYCRTTGMLAICAIYPISLKRSNFEQRLSYHFNSQGMSETLLSAYKTLRSTDIALVRVYRRSTAVLQEFILTPVLFSLSVQQVGYVIRRHGVYVHRWCPQLIRWCPQLKFAFALNLRHCLMPCDVFKPVSQRSVTD